MGKYYSTFKKGTLEMLFLKLLDQNDLYGYEIGDFIHKLSKNIISINAGNMYPTLYKLEEKGYISSYEKVVGKRLRRVYYHITEEGRKELHEMIKDYCEIVAATQNILSYQVNLENKNEKMLYDL